MSNKKKILIGVAILAVGGMLLWKANQKKKFTGFAGKPCGNCGGVVGNRQ